MQGSEMELGDARTDEKEPRHSGTATQLSYSCRVPERDEESTGCRRPVFDTFVVYNINNKSIKHA